ncbi:hypothetical protein BFJ71_g10476 [Fusarium oxysporum]|nr:hypothetical protein BFJ71_g10476 [Fusarium oxysporum]
MVSHGAQYHHYIPRFILKEFAHTNIETKGGRSDGLLHVFDLPSRQFRLGEVGKTCGAQNLYYNVDDNDPMRIEHLFSKLESKTSSIFAKIRTAVTEGLEHIDILEKDIHILFKFINLSLSRSKQYRDELNNPYRENDFMFQHLFETSRKSGRSGEPGQFWLEHLLYLLKTDHEGLLTDAARTDNMGPEDTYKHLIESYALQIWKAADGYEFFLNERLVDFEGDAQSFLGAEVKETRTQLIWMTTEDMIHLILPISPEVAVIFCNESRCWESPIADIEHMTAFDEVVNIINTTHEELQRTKENGLKSWLAFRTSEAIMTSSSRSDDKSSSFRIMHPALKAAFEAAYPPKHPAHKDLVTIDFGEFLGHAIGDEMFAKLSFEINKKIKELVHTYAFHSHSGTFGESSRPPANSLLEECMDDLNEQPSCQKDILESPSFGSVFRAAIGFDVLKWMFEERQDILATFIKQIAVPMEAMHPRVFRMRARRE